ncbi:MAG: hypothetical protein AAGA61_03930, partial [Pseudomonadota bacterium]
MRLIRVVQALSFGALAASVTPPGIGFAHHGWGSYRTDVEMVLTITELKLGNPHDRLLAVDADGAAWNLLLAPPARNRRFGFDENTVSVGDEVELFGRRHPKRAEIKVHCLFVGGEIAYTYRYSNGTSSLKRHGRD